MRQLEVALLVVLAGRLFVCWTTTGQPGAETCEDGWFGSRCQYKCRCNMTTCGSRGQCSDNARCQEGWFGPSCQYVDLAFGRSSYAEVTDGDDDTCLNDSHVTRVTIELGDDYPITWVRLHLSKPGYLYRFKFRVRNGNTFLKCSYIFRSTIDEQTRDLHCGFNETVNAILVAGRAMQFLCSVYMSGGRNVALKQSAKMSSVYLAQSHYPNRPNVSYHANLAVDGNTNQDAILGESCAHTQLTGNCFWSLKMFAPVLVNRYVIYNRDKANTFTLIGFTLISFDQDDNAVFDYTDGSKTAKSIYNITHEDLTIQAVNIDANASMRFLTLCEVEIYGDSVCNHGYFGLDCEKTCNCYYQEDCFASTGGCPTGCAKGFTGEDCNRPCPLGRHGTGCSLKCSPFCVSNSQNITPCDSVDGACLRGCVAGYQPPKCISVCYESRYGPNCSKPCSPACRRPSPPLKDLCDRLSGKCMYGCDVGYYGLTCSVSCRPNTYGKDCGSYCNRGCAQPNDSATTSCHHITGECLQGCAIGYSGSLCANRLTSWQERESHIILGIVDMLMLCSAVLVVGLLTVVLFLFCLRKHPLQHPEGEWRHNKQVSHSVSPSLSHVSSVISHQHSSNTSLETKGLSKASVSADVLW